VLSGPRIRLNLSEAATVTLTFHRITTGRRVRGHCVKTTKANHRAPKCSRYVRRGQIKLAARAGQATVRVQQLLGKKPLPPGRYRVTIRAIDAAGNAALTQTKAFRIKR
jgi:hypothetical protein